MSLGAGIFASVVVVCLLVFYLATRDRWRWKRILLWSVTGLVALVAGIWGYLLYQDIPTQQTEYLSIPLGVSKEEVLYRRGEPTTVFRKPTQVEDFTASEEDKGDLKVAGRDGKYPEGKTARDYDFWSWEKATEPLSLIAFENNAVVRIVCYAAEGTWCPPLAGIGSGYSEQQVLSKLGEPTKSELGKDNKTFTYQDLNLKVTFWKQKAQRFTVTNEIKAP